MRSFEDIQTVLDYIETNIDSKLNIEALSKIIYVSKDDLSKSFSALCGECLNDYIRKRKLSIAGERIIHTDSSITDIAFNLNYGTLESFSRAFTKFHNATPREIRNKTKSINYFNKINLAIKKNGGFIMNFEIVTTEKLILTGFKTKMKGKINERYEQQSDFIEQNREKEEFLFNNSANKEIKIIYSVINNITDNDFDFYIAYNCGDKILKGYEQLEIKEAKYLKFTTGKSRKPVKELIEIFKIVDNDWLKTNNFILDAKNPILEKYYWYMPEAQLHNERYIEYYIPIK